MTLTAATLATTGATALLQRAAVATASAAVAATLLLTAAWCIAGVCHSPREQ